MKKLRTIVVDDEPLALRLMLSLLSNSPELDIVTECVNGREAVDAVLELAPDLMFLDIRMPGLNGFEVIKKIQPELLPMVVFCTAFERYALDAFDVHAVDYIVKPVDEERCQLAVKRALARYRQHRRSDLSKSQLIGAIDSITKSVAERPPVRRKVTGEPESEAGSDEKKIAIKDRDSIKLIKESSIVWVDAAGDYMCIHADDETHILRCTLKQLLADLDSEKFKRVHRSTIVNLTCIEQVIPHTKGEYYLQLEVGERIKVSRNFRAVIKDYLNSMNLG